MNKKKPTKKAKSNKNEDLKLDLDKLEAYDFKVSINNLYQAFFDE